MPLCLSSVDAVSKKIAGSHSRRQQFRGLCKEAGLDHRTPIAGYGIRWNVIYDSRNRMCAAQEVSFLFYYLIHTVTIADSDVYYHR